jgi:hypothetical protein
LEGLQIQYLTVIFAFVVTTPFSHLPLLSATPLPTGLQLRNFSAKIVNAPPQIVASLHRYLLHKTTYRSVKPQETVLDCIVSKTHPQLAPKPSNHGHATAEHWH